MDAVRKTHDYVLAYRGIAAGGGRCRVRVYEEPGHVPVVIVSGLEYGPDTTVSALAEYLAADVIARHFPERFEEKQPVCWIENYERNEWELRRKLPEFLLVEFASYVPRTVEVSGEQRVRIGTPRWTRIARETVEAMIGQSVE
jgi:hypothetical protein